MPMEDLWLRQSVHGWVLFLGIKNVYSEKSERNYRGKCLDWLVTSYGGANKNTPTRFLSASEGPQYSHIITLHRGVCRSAIRWKQTRAILSPGMLWQSCPWSHTFSRACCQLHVFVLWLPYRSIYFGFGLSILSWKTKFSSRSNSEGYIFHWIITRTSQQA